MYAHQTKLVTEDVLELRREGGRYVRELREAAGLTQRQLAALIKVEFYTFVSQIETGRGRIPPHSYQLWADALGVDVKDFVLDLMRFYDPVTYNILNTDVIARRCLGEAARTGL
ncbi:MAG: helix-turn-helix transcriptional regulator [Methylobacterium sp.]|uniref:helix-turn-helix domain-containing protein n=1 Tax=Methylobacterium sp. TaxID=409 RepID=UPI0027289FBD|nr:helix-turn-helix transcriptional regulator [Methylobacterium sp.]MDO9427134.1 helix-turn-helix transcriptional regulator [Methylobacterium sp.]